MAGKRRPPAARQVYSPPPGQVPPPPAPRRLSELTEAESEQPDRFRLFELSSASRDELPWPERTSRFPVRELRTRRGRTMIGMHGALVEAGIHLDREDLKVRKRVGIGDGSRLAELVVTDRRVVVFAPGRRDRLLVDIPVEAVTDVQFRDDDARAVVSIGYLTPLGGQRLGLSAYRKARRVLQAMLRPQPGWGAAQAVVAGLSRLYLRASGEEAATIGTFRDVATALGYELSDHSTDPA